MQRWQAAGALRRRATKPPNHNKRLQQRVPLSADIDTLALVFDVRSWCVSYSARMLVKGLSLRCQSTDTVLTVAGRCIAAGNGPHQLTERALPSLKTSRSTCMNSSAVPTPS